MLLLMKDIANSFESSQSSTIQHFFDAVVMLSQLLSFLYLGEGWMIFRNHELVSLPLMRFEIWNLIFRQMSLNVY